MDEILVVISDQFTNREIALAIWMLLLFVWLLRLKPVRDTLGKAIHGSIKIFLGSKILLIFLLLGLYVFFLIFVLQRSGIWTSRNHLKDTIIWTITVALAMVISIANIKTDEDFFRKAVIGALQLTIVLEFVAETHSFSLPFELVLVPVFVILGGVIAIGDRRQNYLQAKKAAVWILAIIGFLTLGHSVRSILADTGSFFTWEQTVDLLLPSILTVAFLPFIYFLALFIAYEEVFQRVNFRNDDAKLIKYTKRRVLMRFGLNYRSLIEWSRLTPDLKVREKQEVLELVGRTVNPIRY